ncbi:MAG TPA: hypothetical protein VK528_01905, partial [Flavobacterium sp.]|nr:hypothetical protein [Flavobacterium sp.]
MKKLFALLLFCPFFSNAQISLAHTFNFSNNQTNLLYIDLGDGDFKYVAVDYVNSKINIYNTDFTPYLTNITTALPMTSHEIAYISKKLFDCDSTTIEYVLVDNDFTEFRVFNTSGAPVFSRVNVIAPFCYGCYNASLERKPIVNTAEGTKLILSDVNGFNTYVYNLCGTLPLQVTDFEETGNMLTVYPVPA